MIPFLLGAALLLLLFFGARAFVSVEPARLIVAAKAFIATFAFLASTGLLVAGRIGLALMAAGATFMAIRALRHSSSPGFADAGHAAQAGGSARTSSIATDTLAMELDHVSGDLDGEVLLGRFGGRTLASLGLDDLLALLADCERDDPRSVPLLETYLDRRAPDWRSHAASDRRTGREHGTAGVMDDATARSILGVSSGAGPEEIKAAHRRLMTKLHPDHGGSSYLAAQLNQAKDVLLRGRR